MGSWHVRYTHICNKEDSVLWTWVILLFPFFLFLCKEKRCRRKRQKCNKLVEGRKKEKWLRRREWTCRCQATHKQKQCIKKGRSTQIDIPAKNFTPFPQFLPVLQSHTNFFISNFTLKGVYIHLFYKCKRKSHLIQYSLPPSILIITLFITIVPILCIYSWDERM